MTSEPRLEAFDSLVGRWRTEATHPALPGVVVRGTVEVEWLEGRRFLIHRAQSEHPDFPDSISILGFTERDRVEPTPVPGPSAEASQLSMHYFDSRGVFRVYAVSLDEKAWQIWRDAPGFSQRFTGTFVDNGRTLHGLWQVCEDDVRWNDDLQITYRRHE